MFRAPQCSWLPVCTLGLVLSLLGSSVLAEEPSFRELVRAYSKNRQKGMAAAPPEGLPENTQNVLLLDFEVLLTGSDGVEKTVNPSAHKFAIDDEIRVRVKPASDMHVYIFHEDRDGKKVPLLPNAAEKAPFAKAGEAIELPGDGTVFKFTPPAGREKLIIVAADQPITDLRTWAEAINKMEKGLPADQQSKIKSKGETTLESIKTSVEKGKLSDIGERGLQTPEARRAMSKQLSQLKLEQAMVVVPPKDSEPGMAVGLTVGTKTPTELLFEIPLNSK